MANIVYKSQIFRHKGRDKGLTTLNQFAAHQTVRFQFYQPCQLKHPAFGHKCQWAPRARHAANGTSNPAPIHFQ